jgi:hypothetical protein
MASISATAKPPISATVTPTPPSIRFPFICRAWELGQRDNGLHPNYGNAPYFSQ